MPLYTKCPSCRAEISFEPPQDIASLPEDYKYPIRCPACGVTIGVKLNSIARQPAEEQNFEQTAAQQEQNYEDESYSQEEQEDNTVAARDMDKPAKKKGTGRNIILMLLSFVFIAYQVVGYLMCRNIIPVNADILAIFLNLTNVYGGYGNGIFAIELLIRDPAAITGMIAGVGNFLTGFSALLSILILVMSVVTFLVAFISACGKKYSRAFNVVWSILFFLAVGVSTFIMAFFGLASGDEFDFVGLLKLIGYVPYAILALSFLQMLLSLIFIKSLVIKPAKQDD